MLTFKNLCRVFSGIVEARMLKLRIHMENELLCYGIATVFSGTVQGGIFKHGIHNVE